MRMSQQSQRSGMILVSDTVNDLSEPTTGLEIQSSNNLTSKSNSPLSIPQSRWTLIQYLINQVTPACSGHLISCRCLPKVLLLAKSAHGVMTRKQKTLQKVDMTPSFWSRA